MKHVTTRKTDLLPDSVLTRVFPEFCRPLMLYHGHTKIFDFIGRIHSTFSLMNGSACSTPMNLR